MSEYDRESGSPAAILELLRESLRRWRFVTAMVVAAAVVALLLTLVVTPVYQATVTVLPRGDSARFGLLGSLFDVSGLSAAGSAGNEVLYAKILVSDDVLVDIIERTWTYRGSATPVTLYEVLGIDRHSGEDGVRDRARAELMERLRDGMIGMTRDKTTGFMTVRVRVPRDPALAAELANALVDRLDEYNIGTSTSRAGRQLRFLEARLLDVRRELTAAEDSLVDFVERNRAYRDAPILNQRYQRLQREAEATNAVWIELRRQVELTRLEEQRQLTTLDILDRAVAPVKPVTPDLLLNLIVAGCLGFVAAVIVVEVRLLRRAGIV